MNSNAVIQIFAGIANLSITEATAYAHLARLAVSLVKNNVKDPQSLETHNELLNHVAAATMYYWYQLSRTSSQPAGSFYGNGIQIKSKNSDEIEAARLIRDEWWANAKSLLKDAGNFLFVLTPEAEHED